MFTVTEGCVEDADVVWVRDEVWDVFGARSADVEDFDFFGCLCREGRFDRGSGISASNSGGSSSSSSSSSSHPESR